ncbi:MAG: alanine racemase [Anaerolineaceae bacterium]|nr:alanine racemase [Anaerolineaceae bacterium]
MLEGALSRVEVDLDAISFNVKGYRRHIGPQVEIIAVVKGNAYGHGAVPVAKVALAAGANRLAVHRAGEGIELRKAGIEAPILIMGYTPPDGAPLITQWHLTPSLITREFAIALSEQASSLGVTVPVHIKVDTGMSRFGLLPGEVLDFLRELRDLPGIFPEGLFTHFATADWEDASFTHRQLNIFQDVLDAAHRDGFDLPYCHAANSAAAMRLPETLFNAVRLGIALYGMDPSEQWPTAFEIRPALALKSTVSRVRELPPGSGISYGLTYVTQTNSRAALVPVGYGDGYHRSLSNRGSVLIHGQRAPIRGRMCMDQFVVDVSDIADVRQDDEVVLIGKQGDDQIRAEELAHLAGTINYEITTSLLPRIPRLYLQAGQPVKDDNSSD